MVLTCESSALTAVVQTLLSNLHASKSLNITQIQQVIFLQLICLCSHSMTGTSLSSVIAFVLIFRFRIVYEKMCLTSFVYG